MIARSSIVDAKSNLKITQESLDRLYLNHQCGTFKIDNALVYQILSKLFTDKVAYVYVKQKKSVESCKSLTMIMRGKGGIGTSMLHSTKNSISSWRALQIMATVEWTMASKSTTLSNASRVVSWKQWTMLFGLNQKSMEWILMQLCLSGPNGHKERPTHTICPYCKNQKSANEA